MWKSVQSGSMSNANSQVRSENQSDKDESHGVETVHHLAGDSTVLTATTPPASPVEVRTNISLGDEETLNDAWLVEALGTQTTPHSLYWSAVTNAN